jgi:hypothetical protein
MFANGSPAALFPAVNIAGLNPQPERAALGLPFVWMGAREAAPQMSGASGLNMFLSTLSSVVEKMSPTPRPAPAPREPTATMPRPASTQPASPQSAFIQEPARQLAVAKDQTKDQSLPEDRRPEPSAGTAPYMLAPALPVASLQLDGGKSSLAPDLSGGYASPTRSETSPGQHLVDVSAVACTDTQTIAMPAATPLAFRLQLTAAPEAGAKETLPQSGEISKPAILGNQQTSVQSPAPVLPSEAGNPPAPSGLAVMTGTEKTSTAPIYPAVTSSAGQNASNASPLKHSTTAVHARSIAIAPRSTAVDQSPISPRSSASLPSDNPPSASLPSANLPSDNPPSDNPPSASLPSASLPSASAARSSAAVPLPGWVTSSPIKSPLIGIGPSTSTAVPSTGAARSSSGAVPNARYAVPSDATSGRMDMSTAAGATQTSASAVVSEAAGAIPSPVAASLSSPKVSAPNPNPPGASVAARVSHVSMPAAKPELFRPAQPPSGVWISPGASTQHISDSQPPSVEELTTSGIEASQDGDGSPPQAAVTAMNFPQNPAPPRPEPELASTSSVETSGVSPLAESSPKLSASPANEDRSASGRRSAESPSKAAAPENVTRPSQSIREPQDGEQRRKEPGNVAADKPGPSQEKPGPGDAFRQTGAGALQARETTTARGADDARSDTAEQPPELPRVIDPQPGTGVVLTAPARQISLNLAGSGSAGVAVQLRERAGRIEVAVRSGDSQLAKSLQSGLGDLVTRLENQGFKTQAWVPAAARQTSTAASSWESAPSQQQQGHSSAGNGNQQRQGDSSQRRQPRPSARFEESMADEDARMKSE